MKKIAFAIFALLVSTLPALADTAYPLPGYEEKPSPYASERALPGGKISVWAGANPKSLNALLDNNSFSAQIFGMMYESLLETDPATTDYAPGLAKSWTVSDDGNTFTFTLDPDARWSDGRPITAEDVAWSFAAIMNPTNMTGSYKVSLSKFTQTPPEILAPDTIRFTASEVHWRNLGAAGGFPILPKHAFEDKDFNKINFEFPVVSGPYRLGKLTENIAVEMLRRRDWWANDKPRNRYIYNFDVIEFRVLADRENAWEAFRKGQFDLYPIYTARIWVESTRGERFDKNWIVKRDVKNRKPVGFQGFAMNMRRAPYDDPRVRKALAHMLDRDTLNRTMMYSQYFLHRSYYEDLYDAEHPCENPFFEFDPQKARTLLSDAGWVPDPATGLLAKDGKPLVLTFLTRDGVSDKFIARYRSDLEKIGVRLVTDRKDWAAWSRDMDAYNFEMTWAAWGAGLHKDPEAMWHSTLANDEGGINITAFADPRVDALIERQKTEFSVAVRNDIVREIDAILTEHVPYILLWNTSSTRLLWWNKFGVPDEILSRYGNEDAALVYWWYDPDADATLKDGMRRKIKIPAP